MAEVFILCLKAVMPPAVHVTTLLKPADYDLGICSSTALPLCLCLPVSFSLSLFTLYHMFSFPHKYCSIVVSIPLSYCHASYSWAGLATEMRVGMKLSKLSNPLAVDTNSSHIFCYTISISILREFHSGTGMIS